MINERHQLINGYYFRDGNIYNGDFTFHPPTGLYDTLHMKTCQGKITYSNGLSLEGLIEFDYGHSITNISANLYLKNGKQQNVKLEALIV